MITIVDYGMGNLRSVEKAFNRLQAEVLISSDPEKIRLADKILLPGVGHFKRGMENLEKTGLLVAINEAKDRGIPILGICLGMQLLTNSSEESGGEGLGYIQTNCVHFKDHPGLKVPHMGWNSIELRQPVPLLKGIETEDSFYFAHSYHANSNSPDEVVVAVTEYGGTFPCIIQYENVIGVQFHPEKSFDAGLRLLKNFISEY